MRAIETPYLFVNGSGQPLSESQQESLISAAHFKKFGKKFRQPYCFIDKAEAYDMQVTSRKRGHARCWACFRRWT